ncbi:MAG: hypothetical protein GWO02_10600, partial [Gammaproteobacteria bacterium]|nr:hypothetical protein [Gammaproteobacteria bacterium]
DIFGVGYLKSPALTSALDRLRRLAQETGGLYVTVEPDAVLPADFASRAFAQLASGGRMEVDLSPAARVADALPAEAILALEWRGTAGNASAHLPLRIPP